MDRQDPRLGREVITEGLGRFDVLEFLGAGRFGETYRVVRDGDEYALKICHFLPRMPESLWAREIEALRRVSHPNVMGFRGTGTMRVHDATYAYLECEYCAGGDVAGRIETGELPETAAQLRGFVTGLLRGVKELHELGILHHDIRPSNVALRDGDWARPVLLDFGLAHATCTSAAQQRLAIVDRRKDIVAVAAVSYEAGTGRPPFDPSPDQPILTAPDRRTRRAIRDPRTLSHAFDDVVATLVLLVLSHAHTRLGAHEALQQLGAE